MIEAIFQHILERIMLGIKPLLSKYSLPGFGISAKT